MARIADLLPCELAALAFLVSGLLCEQWVFSLLFYGTRGRVGLWTAAGGLHGLVPCPCRPFPRRTMHRIGDRLNGVVCEYGRGFWKRGGKPLRIPICGS